MVIPKELKEAISALGAKDKDKLIFRLLKKDITLANQLLFELVSLDSVELRRETTKKAVQVRIDIATKSYYSPGYLYMDIRDMSGVITEHVKITKDKYGEISLNLWMISEVLERNNDKMLSTSIGKSEKLCVSVIARAFKILMLIKKMHVDYLVDFEEDMSRFGQLIGSNPYLMKTAIYNGFDVNWLIQAEIPENIDEIYKDLRARGYLR